MKTVFRLPQWETLKDVLYFIRNNVGSKGWVVIDDKIENDGYLVLRNASSEMYVKFWVNLDFMDFIFCDVGEGWDGTNILNKKNVYYDDSETDVQYNDYTKKYDSYLVVDENFIFVGWYADANYNSLLFFIYLTKFSSFNNDVCWIINITNRNVYEPAYIYKGVVINDIQYIDDYNNMEKIKSNVAYYDDWQSWDTVYIRYDVCKQVNDYSFTNILVKPLLFLYEVDLYNNGVLYTYPVCFLPFYMTSLKKEQRFPHIVVYQTKNYFLTPGFLTNNENDNIALAFEVDNTSF